MPFARFQARADIWLGSAAGDRFNVEALVTLGSGSDGFDPLAEDVTLALAPGRWTGTPLAPRMFATASGLPVYPRAGG